MEDAPQESKALVRSIEDVSMSKTVARLIKTEIVAHQVSTDNADRIAKFLSGSQMTTPERVCL
jgi:hypothetical protein